MHYRIPEITLKLVVREPRNYEPVPVGTPQDAVRFLKPLQESPNEVFAALHLNTRHGIIGFHKVSEGTISASLVHPREIFKAAILSNAYAILVAHNHPSGEKPTPSKEDLSTTEQLLKVAEFIGIAIVDHLIIGPGGEYYSIRENHPFMWSKN